MGGDKQALRLMTRSCCFGKDSVIEPHVSTAIIMVPIVFVPMAWQTINDGRNKYTAPIAWIYKFRALETTGNCVEETYIRFGRHVPIDIWVAFRPRRSMKWRYWPETLIAVLVVILDVPGRTPHTTATETSGWTTQKKFDARCAVIQNVCNCSFLIQVLAKRRVSYGITALTTTCLMVRLFSFARV